MALKKRPARKTLLISSGEPERFDAFCDSLEALGSKVSRQQAEDAASWNSDQAMNSYVIPQATLEMIIYAIADWR
jgi:hypothetical protein